MPCFMSMPGLSPSTSASENIGLLSYWPRSIVVAVWPVGVWFRPSRAALGVASRPQQRHCLPALPPLSFVSLVARLWPCAFSAWRNWRGVRWRVPPPRRAAGIDLHPEHWPRRPAQAAPAERQQRSCRKGHQRVTFFEDLPDVNARRRRKCESEGAVSPRRWTTQFFRKTRAGHAPAHSIRRGKQRGPASDPARPRETGPDKGSRELLARAHHSTCWRRSQGNNKWSIRRHARSAGHPDRSVAAPASRLPLSGRQLITPGMAGMASRARQPGNGELIRPRLAASPRQSGRIFSSCATLPPHRTVV